MMGDQKNKKAKTDSNSTGVSDELMREVISKFDQLTKTVDQLSKKVEDNSENNKENFKASNIFQDDIQEKLGNFIAEFERMKGEVESLKKSNCKLRDTVFCLSKKMDQYDWAFEQKARDEKKANLCLDGINEDIKCDLEHVVNDLFHDLGLDYTVREVCQSIYSKGQTVNMNGKP